jgi:acyl carrier protein
MSPLVTLDDIKNIISMQLGADRVTEDDRIAEDLGAESSDLANIISAVEDKYQIEVDRSNLEGIRTVRDVYLEIQKAVNENQQ